VEILLVTRHYPPEQAGGSRRPSALAAGLRALGHRVVVLAPTGSKDFDIISVPHPVFPNLPDASQLTDTPKGSILDWARRWLLLPDPEVRWILRAVDYAKVAGIKPDWIITTSPPESVHLAGLILKRHFKARWLADVRDLWLQSPLRKERLHWLRKLAEGHIAKWTLGQADALVGVSDVVLSEALKLSKSRTSASKVIGHFAQGYEGSPRQLPGDRFNIVHTGSIGLSNNLSDATMLLKDFEGLAAVRPDVHLWLAGRLSALEVEQFKSSPFAARITLMGVVSLDDARALQLGADALAIVSGPQSHALPGKFSEYLTAGHPILTAGTGPWQALIEPGSTLQFDEAIGLKKYTDDPTIKVALPFHVAAAAKFIELMVSCEKQN
jgi:glycosyltransferase involved in cell wall biosynthesis